MVGTTLTGCLGKVRDLPGAEPSRRGSTGCDAGADPSCHAAPLCGDGHVDPGEQCDDANGEVGDGCAPDCTQEGPAAGVAGVLTTPLGGLDYCIVFTVAPLRVPVGAPVAVSVFPNDSRETIRWSTSGQGSFVDSTAASTTYVCDRPGEHRLSLTVSDCPEPVDAIVRCD